MKKIFFLSVIVTLAITFTTNAQQAPKPMDPMVFNPGIFSPIPMGTTQRGIAYIKEAPVLSGVWPTPMVAYVQMLTPTGILVEVPISGLLVNTPPDWTGYFIMNRDTQVPVKYPKIVPVSIEVRGAIATDGRQLLDAKGNPIAVTKVFF